MTNGKFSEGVAILAKYAEPGGRDVCARHDQLWFHHGDVSEEDERRLVALGWFRDDDDAWSCFT